MSDASDVQRWLRHRVLGLLHGGQVGPGARLPSIRQVSEQTGADHRAVAEAYRRLEREGLVGIRPGSGVYVADGGHADGVRSETSRWLAEILLGGWTRRLSRARTGELVSRCGALRLRCVCLESNEDHMVALCAELEEGFSLGVVPIMVEPDAGADDVPWARLRGADLVVSTVFHADLARAAAERTGALAVAVTAHRDFTAEIDRRLREGVVTAVFVDPRFADRARAHFGVTAHRGRIDFIALDRLGEMPLALDDERVLITRAARQRLGLEEYHLLPPPLSLVSTETARELFEVIARTALAREP